MNDENLTLKEIQLFVSNLQSRTCKIESDQATIQRVGFQLQIEWLYLIQRTLLIIY